MFVILLKFSARQSHAPQHMEGHKAWIREGFDDGVFLLAGSLHARQGGAVLAHGLTRAELEARVRRDPFVVEDVVGAEIIELSPNLVEPRLQFLMEGGA